MPRMPTATDSLATALANSAIKSKSRVAAKPASFGHAENAPTVASKPPIQPSSK